MSGEANNLHQTAVLTMSQHRHMAQKTGKLTLISFKFVIFILHMSVFVSKGVKIVVTNR